MLGLMDIFQAFQVGVFGFVFCVLLMEQGQILSWYDDWLSDVEEELQWLSHPMGRCEKCFTGQVSFWLWLFQTSEYCPIEHALFVSFSILFVHSIKTIFILCR